MRSVGRSRLRASTGPPARCRRSSSGVRAASSFVAKRRRSSAAATSIEPGSAAASRRTSRPSDGGQLLLVDLARPDFPDACGRLLLPADILHLLRRRIPRPLARVERLRLQNYGRTVQRLRLGVHFALDFVDIFEVRGHPPAARGSVQSVSWGDGRRWRSTWSATGSRSRSPS